MRKKWLIIVMCCFVLCHICCGCGASKNNEGAFDLLQNGGSEKKDFSEYSDYPVLSIEYLNYYLQSRGILENGLGIDVNDYMQGDIIYLKRESKLFGDDYYALTNKMNPDLVYYGAYKNNKPDGLGMIGMIADVRVELDSESGNYYLTYYRVSQNTEESNMAFVVSYIGDFSEGRYDGTGYAFESPLVDSDSEYSESYVITPEEYTNCDGNYQLLLSRCANPIVYVGEFKNGKINGTGMQIIHNDVEIDEENLDIYETKEKSIWIGDFKEGRINGNVKEYFLGKLQYVGEMVQGRYSGKGTLYYKDTGKVKYEGEFLGGDYDGKGTLYDENGEVIYSGKWSDGDYAN